MDRLFAIQLATSFIVGGGIVALLSFMAERASSRIAGILISFPTTVALSFFFLGWTSSPENVARIAPASLIPLGLSMLFAAIYAYAAGFFSKYVKGKLPQISITFLLSISAWFILGLPVVIFELSSLAMGITGYVLLITLAHCLLHKKSYEKPVSLTYTISQKAARAVFVGFIIVLAVFLGKTLSPFWGGMFAMFPAAFSSLMIILHWHYGPKSLFPTMQKVAIGSVSMFAYAITVMLIFSKTGFVMGTFFAYAISMAVTLLLMNFQPRTKEIFRAS